MKFWQPIVWTETEQLPAIARFAEEVGFHGLMNADHALYPQTMAADYPYSDTGRPPQTAASEYPDCFVSIAAMAAVTSTIKFTTGVYVLPLRNPIELAKATATLSILSQGRFMLGVGSGWMREEFDIYGVDFDSRGKRLSETVEVLTKLWRGEMVEHRGDFFDFPAIQISPRPSHPIPIYFGGNAPVALKRCARFGAGWIGSGNRPEDVPAIMGKLQALRVEAGRDHLPFETLVGLLSEPTVETFRALQDTGMTSGLNTPFSYVLGEKSSLDDKKRLMEKFARDVIRQFE